MIIDTDQLKIFYDDGSEIVAVYREGELVACEYLDEALPRVFGCLGVQVEETDRFLLGTDNYAREPDRAADTLREIEEWDRTVGERIRRAGELERRARELQEEAARLREGSEVD